MKYSTTYSGREAFSSWRRLKKSSQCLATSSLLYNTYTTVSQIYYQDQGVRDQDQTGRDQDQDQDQQGRDQDQDLKKVLLIGLETKTRSRDPNPCFTTVSQLFYASQTHRTHESWCSPSLSGWPVCAGPLCAWSPATTFHGVWDSAGPACPDCYRSAQLRYQWTTNMEQSASRS